MAHHFAPVMPEEVAALGLSRHEARSLARLSDDRGARLAAMALLQGLDPGRLAADRDLHIAAALACLGCDQPHGKAAAACPNAETYRMLAAG